jgi:hypothetical protein
MAWGPLEKILGGSDLATKANLTTDEHGSHGFTNLKMA